MALISAQTLTVERRLKAASLTLERGEVLGLIGPNGAGKSTLLNALAGIERHGGEVNIDGLPATELAPNRRARLIGLLPQNPGAAWSLRVADVVALGRIPWGDNDEAMIREAMARAGIKALAARRIDELSGGERARVWLARVFAGAPQALLADEPMASLDIHYQLAVMEALREYAREGHGVLVAMHDLGLAARYCNRLCLMNEGEIVSLGEPSSVLSEPLLHRVYGVAVEVDLTRDPPVIMPR